jgi:hypothetical protein
MTDAASALRAAAFCFHFPINLSEIDEGIEWVEAAIAALPPGTDPNLVRMVETLDWRRLEMVANELERRAATVSKERTAEHSVVSKPAKRQHKPREQHMPDGLLTQARAAARLGCSIKTLNGHVASGALRYVNTGHGEKRPRRMFTDQDINEFIAAQTRKDVSCPSIKIRARHSGTSISSGAVIAFTARQSARPGGKRKK